MSKINSFGLINNYLKLNILSRLNKISLFLRKKGYMCFKMKTIFTITLLLFCVSIFSQNTELESQLIQANNKKDSINILIDLSESYRFTHPEKGLEYALKALGISLSVFDTLLMVQSASKLAMLQKENSLKTTAKGTIIQSLTWAKAFGDKKLITNAQLITGHIYSSLNNSSLALEYYTQCLKSFKENNDSSGMSYTYSGLGIVHYDNGRYEKALNSYLNAEEFWVDEGFGLKSDLWNNIGALYVVKKDYKKAKYYYNQALITYDTNTLTSEVSMVYYNIGELELLQNHFAEARAAFNKSMKIGREINSATEVMFAYEGLYLTAKKEGKIKDALFAHESYMILKDSLDELQNKKDVLQIETLYHHEEHLKKIKDQELKIIQSERKIEITQFKNIIYVVFSVFIFCTLILSLILYLKSRKWSNILLGQKESIEVTLKEKEVLLKEIHHRVKNNLQIISSLLNLQKNSLGNEEANYVIDETQNRIKAIALVHQKLYQSKNVGKIDFGNYLEELVEQQGVVFFDAAVLIRKEINVSIAINIDISVSLGLITSELIINSFKHAFVKENENVLTINLEEKEEGCYALIIRDNGGGLPPDYENSQKESLGMDLVKILTEQINGTLDYKFEKGAVFTINFKA